MSLFNPECKKCRCFECSVALPGLNRDEVINLIALFGVPGPAGKDFTPKPKKPRKKKVATDPDFGGAPGTDVNGAKMTQELNAETLFPRGSFASKTIPSHSSFKKDFVSPIKL
jgi:hypothetical protein